MSSPGSVLPVEEVTVSANRLSEGFNISRFKSAALSPGLMRPTLYDVTITQLDNRVYQFLTEAVALPTVGVDTQAIRRYGYGPVDYVPFRPVFQDSVRINLITQASKANALTQFLNSVSEISPFMNYKTMGTEESKINAYEVKYKKKLEFDMLITIYNELGEVKSDIMMYTFKQCYAKQVGGIDLGWGSNDQYVRTSVDFAFTDFSIDSAPEIGIGIGRRQVQAREINIQPIDLSSLAKLPPLPQGDQRLVDEIPGGG
jgi:hypothetical protein